MNLISVEAEQSVIGAILQDGRVFGQICELVTPGDFFDVRHRDMMVAASNLSAKGGDIDVVTLGEEITRTGGRYDLQYAIEIAHSTPGSANVKSYAHIVRDKSKRRTLQITLEQAALSVAESGSVPVDELTAQVAAQIGVLQGESDAQQMTLNEIIKAVVQNIDHRFSMKEGEIDGLATGLKRVDERYCGLKPGDLVVFAGRPSMGKTVLGMQVALSNAIYHGKTCQIFSLEMTATQLIERGIASAGSVNLGHMKNPKKAHEGMWESLMVGVEKLKNRSVFIDETPRLHINQICARARIQHAKQPLDLVVVDHIHLAQGDGQSREREMASITSGLKGLAKELGCPVIAVAQLNRGVEQRPDKRPLMSDLRDSGSIEQDADIITLLYRDEYYNPDTPDKGIIELITGKHRNGEVGKDFCSAQLHMSRITDLAPDYEPRQPQPAKAGRGFQMKNS